MISEVIQVIIGYLLADFLAGIYHWIKDSYFDPYTPIIGKLFIWNSRLHHIKPRYILEFTDLELFLSSAKWSLSWFIPLFYLFGPSYFLSSIFFFISMNDVIHKHSHLLKHERPYWSNFLQKNYIFQSYEEHHHHHFNPYEINYCPISPYVNVVLERFNFWRRLEKIIENLLGVKAREHESLYVEDNNYPAGIRFLEHKN